MGFRGFNGFFDHDHGAQAIVVIVLILIVAALFVDDDIF